MLRHLRRWLGWETDSDPPGFIGARPRQRPAPKQVAETRSRPAGQAPAQRATTPARSPIDVLDDPRLSLDKPADDGFDPYNTGAFNRSASWERIGRQRKA